ncbi:MAG TPA: hypothetical protein VEF03_11055, partial [Candidatus Binataceae bacterium]|nr:hypothetical protein [Candidatus Binataceae bacterium]
TVLSFTAINLGLSKLDPQAFEIIGKPTLFQFFHYSFSALLFGSIAEITHVRPISEAAFMLEEFAALVLVVILASVLVFVRNDRQVRDLDAVIADLQEEANRAESRIKQTYRLNSIEEARAEIAKLQGIFLNIFEWLSRN